jgi:hypothetical protein
VADPFGQFAWLESVLTQVEADGGRAWVVGHIAPTVDSYDYDLQWQRRYAARYTGVLARFGHVTRAHFFGHLHTDEFRLVTTSEDSDEAGWEDDARDLGGGGDHGDAWWAADSTPLLLAGGELAQRLASPKALAVSSRVRSSVRLS